MMYGEDPGHFLLTLLLGLLFYIGLIKAALKGWRWIRRR